MFKLLNLKFKGHPYLGDIELTFSPDSERDSENYTTLIIGPNGTGKSQILLAVVQIFNRLVDLQNRGRRFKFDYNFELKYLHEKITYTAIYINKKLEARRTHYVNFKGGSHLATSWDPTNLPLPSKLLLSAFTFNDKFPLKGLDRKKIDDTYKYLGLKSTTNGLFISRPQRDTVLHLIEAVQYQRDLRPLVDVLKKLNLETELGFVYKPSRNFSILSSKIINSYENLNVDQFREIFEQVINKKQSGLFDTQAGVEENSLRMGNDKYQKIFNSPETLAIALAYLKKNIKQLARTKTSKEFTFSVDFSHKESYSSFLENALPFQILQDLEIFSFERFNLTKFDKAFDLDNSSSGEYHLLFIFINILSFIEPDSLVLIDEPEISLHPNWQLQFMGLMQTAFKNFPTTQFIICSHSHFLVSDLRPETSNIISLNFNRENNKIIAKSIKKNTFGWSAEQILLEVFEVPTTRNFYLSAMITEILELMAKPDPDRIQINQKLDELRQFDFSHLNNADPFKVIINKLLTVG